MITSYTYKINSTNPEMGAMEVEFTAPGVPTVVVGARMPYEGEDLDALVRSFAPIAHWESVGKQVADVAVGHEAAVDLTPPAPTVQDQIVALEQANPITHRNLRDLAMAVAALGELVTGQPATNLPMVQTITALEQQIAELRGQL